MKKIFIKLYAFVNSWVGTIQLGRHQLGRHPAAHRPGVVAGHRHYDGDRHLPARRAVLHREFPEGLPRRQGGRRLR